MTPAGPGGRGLLQIDVVSIFPDYFAPLRLSLVGRAATTGLVRLGVHDLRDWTADRHRTVDDTPYGGGAGMVMRPEPWGAALDDLAPAGTDTRLVVPTPSGRRFDQALAAELAAESHLLFACGRYEGIDARVVEHAATRLRVDEVSLGDYVLNGGEVAALAIIEAVVRLLPGVVGNPESLTEESHAPEHEGLLEHPVYTKPARWRDLAVPGVLLSGHHGRVAAWRREQALARTRERRPDLVPSDAEEVVIGPARPGDAGEVLTLEWAAFLPEGRLHRSFTIPPLTETLPEVRAAIRSGSVLVARQGTRLVGSVRAVRESEEVWYVGRLMVAPDRQGHGIGGALMARAEALAPPGTQRVRLTTGANSTDNLRFYRRRGYRERSRTGRAGEVPVVTLEKVLRRPGSAPRGEEHQTVA